MAQKQGRAGARFIAPEHPTTGAPRLRHEFALDAGHGAPVSATMRTSALGIHDTWLNGTRVDDELLAPGWTSYEWRLAARRHDVLDRIRDLNVIGMTLGNGWFRGRLGWEGGRRVYGDQLAGYVELVIRFEDGYEQIVASDDTWISGSSEILADDLYDGQTVDARLVDSRWLEPAFEAVGWAPVRSLAGPEGRLEDPTSPPVRAIEEITPIAIERTSSGRWLIDYGQNLVGWIRLRVGGSRGAEVTVRHTEVLEHGELALRPLRSAEATDRLILSGAAEDVLEPRFTVHGFRYAEIEGWPHEQAPDPSAVTAVVVGSDLHRIGWFRCSDPLVNQLHDNIVWSTRGNFVSIPTDCPQRDERLGWTGDIAVFAPTASFLFDVDAFLGSWLRDLALEQDHVGTIPFVIPDPLKYGPPFMGNPQPPVTAIWSDSAVWVPWALWMAYGDAEIIETQWDSMVAHVASVEAALSPRGLWEDGFQFGDWLDPAAPPERPGDARADHGVVATACAARTARMATEMARAIGRSEEAARFEALAGRLRASFREHYVGADGRILSDAPTVYALAIAFDLLADDVRPLAGDRLATLVAEDGYRISTGFAGTPFISDALTATGHHDVAMRLLLQQERPSWLYPVTMGATTVWERWDSMLPDGSVNPGEMTSFNHYALGAIADWLHRRVAGIAPLEPGYATILFEPRVDAGIDWAEASLRTPHGDARIAWTLDAGTAFVEVTVPDGAVGRVASPAGDRFDVAAGVHRFEFAAPERREPLAS